MTYDRSKEKEEDIGEEFLKPDEAMEESAVKI
jgi:hypothetical protein